MTVDKIIKKLGRKKVMAELGVSSSAVTNAIANNQLPASWFKVMMDLAEGEDLQIPNHLFHMRTQKQTGAVS